MNTLVFDPRPKEEKLRTGIKDRSAIAEAMALVLADTYVLMFKTHAYHWNVVGPMFYSMHKLTEDHYENLFAAADELAERIRALGHVAPMNLAAMQDLAKLEDNADPSSAAEMIADLAQDHERLAHRLHAVIGLGERERDPVTADLATERSAFHEEAVWMLRALIAE